jgi:hypothetical protein
MFGWFAFVSETVTGVAGNGHAWVTSLSVVIQIRGVDVSSTVRGRRTRLRPGAIIGSLTVPIDKLLRKIQCIYYRPSNN